MKKQYCAVEYDTGYYNPGSTVYCSVQKHLGFLQLRQSLDSAVSTEHILPNISWYDRSFSKCIKNIIILQKPHVLL